jgi:hypothetical protein
MDRNCVGFLRPPSFLLAAHVFEAIRCKGRNYEETKQQPENFLQRNRSLHLGKTGTDRLMGAKKARVPPIVQLHN